MKKYTVLIVDDEPTHCKLFSKFVEKLGHNYLVMNSGVEVVDFFISKKSVKGIFCYDVDVMLLDLSMPDMDGLEILKQISNVKGDLQTIVLTANSDISLAIKAINAEAIDYIVKGERDVFTRVSTSIANAIEKKNLKYQVSHLARKNKDQVSFSDILGHSESVLQAINLAKKVINSTVPLLIEGPSGSGKKLLASAIHGSGNRSGKPMVIVECDMLKSGSVEEELFGSDGPVADGMIKNIGKFREANNGTIMLEKVEALKSDIQAKILRFLQEGEITPVEGVAPVRVNVRLIASTAKDLKSLMEARKFREDFYFRLAAFPIKVPSLKERGDEDIKLLSENFCRDFSINENKKIRGISQDAYGLLCSYDWEDNVRQLKNSIFRAVMLCDEEILKREHFPHLINKENSSVARVKSSIKKKSNINSELIDIFDENGTCKTIEILEEEVIRRLVDINNGNLSEVAKQLDIGRSTIYRKLKILNTEEDEK